MSGQVQGEPFGMADKAAKENWNSYQRSKDAGHDLYVTEARKCDRFYRGGGEQWEPEDRAFLEGLGKPVLEINLILSTINALLGEQSSQRVDMVFKPKKKAADATATALTAVALAIQDDNRFDWVESEIFADGIIQDRGYFDIRIDFEKDITGEVRISAEDPINILLDPDAKEYDSRTWNEVIKTKWMTLDEVDEQYGKKARDAVEAFVNTSNTFGSDSILLEEETFGESEQWFGEWQQNDDSRDIRRVRIIERQYKRLGSQRVWIDNETGDISEVPELTTDLRAGEIAEEYNLTVSKKRKRKIRWTVSCDGVTLLDDWSIYRSFTIVPYFPYWRRGKPFGVVRNLLSPQEQLNKLESQELHIVNTTSNSGYTVEAGTLVNMTIEELEERGAETGLVLVHSKGSTPPQKIKPNTVPTGIDRMSGKSAANIREISGVREEMLGATDSDVSGVAMAQARKGGLVQMQVPFDNLARSRHLVAEKMLELIQDFYTETRVFKVVDYSVPGGAAAEVELNSPQPDGSFINDPSVGEYSVTISTQPARDSMEETQFAEALSLRDAGVQIPDDVIIENSHLQHKYEIADRVRNIQGMGELTEEQQQLQELQTQMAIQNSKLLLSELEAKIAKLQSEVALTMQKAQSEGRSGDEEQQRLNLEIAKLQGMMTVKAAELQTSLELAGIHTNANLQQTMFKSLSDRTSSELGNIKDVQVAGIQAASKPKPTASKK